MIEQFSRNEKNFGDKTNQLRIIPDEWQIVSISDVANFTKKPKTVNVLDYPKIPFVPMDYISESSISNDKYELKRHDEITSGTFFLRGDLLIAKITPSFENGKQCIANNIPLYFGFATTEVWPLSGKPELYNLFLFYYLKSNAVRNNIASKMEGTTGRQRVPKYVLENTIIPLPPLFEQHTIAHILSTIQQAIEATDKVITAAQKLKKSLMRHLFTYGPVSLEEAENVPLKEIDIGIVPKHWNIKEMGKIANIKGGKRLPKGHSYSDTPSQYPYLRVVDFKNGSINFDNLKYITPEDREIINNYTISSDDIYISIAGTIGLVGSIPDELDGANLTENAAKIVIKNHNDIDKNYLMCFLESPLGQQQISLLSTKTSQPKLALTRIKQIAVALPPLQEQKEISYILKHTTFKLEKEKNKNSILQTLFNSMLHHLMTGKLRVNDLDLELPEVAE